jgi:stage V sporulation protein R
MSLQQEIIDVATELGFPPRETVFEEVPPDVLYRISGYKLPSNYHHWHHGRDYWIAKSKFTRNHGVIMELVLNTRPAYAYIANNLTEVQKAEVMAHVAGHTHFFNANPLLRTARLDIITQAKGARERFLAYEKEYGHDVVEQTIDAAHALMWHTTVPKTEEVIRTVPRHQIVRSPHSDLMDLTEIVKTVTNEHLELFRLQEEGDSDFLWFTLKYAPLDSWQADILDVVRTQALYFWPLIQTKVIDEGFAAWLQTKILGKLGMVTGKEVVESAYLFSQVIQGGASNPYRLGLMFFRALEETGGDIAAALRENPTTVSMFRNLLTHDMMRIMQLYGVEVKDYATYFALVVDKVPDTVQDAEEIKSLIIRRLDDAARMCVPGVIKYNKGLAVKLLFFLEEGETLEKERTAFTATLLSWLWREKVMVPQIDFVYGR